MPETKPKPDLPDAIVLDEAQKFGLNAAIGAMQEAQARVNALAASIAQANGWPEGTKVEYKDGTLLCAPPSSD